MKKSLSAKHYWALAAFRYEVRKFLRFSKDYLQVRARLTVEQYEILLALKAFFGSGGATVKEVSACLQVRHHTAVGLTDKLVASGLVTKHSSGDDRRLVNVKLTTRGSRLLARVAVPHYRKLSQLSREMIATLNSLKK